MSSLTCAALIFIIGLSAGLVRGGRADSGSSSSSSTSTTNPLADYWKRKAEKRLAMAHRLELQRNNARARLRRVLYGPRSTGVPWLDQALCIHQYESVNWFLDGHHDGGMQFNPGTWRRAGGSGYAFQAAPIEQLYRAFRIWSQDDGSWREWSTAGMCGL